MTLSHFAWVLLLAAAGVLGAGEPQTIPLWPATPPGDTQTLPPEGNTTQPTDRIVAGRPVVRIGNVSQPTITIYSPDPAKNVGAAVLVCPGGGYNIVAIDVEGTEVCEWLNSIGVTGVLLKYRVPRRPGLAQQVPPLQDAQRAMGLVRARAAELGIQPERIGVLGFSAGGHLAAMLGNHPAPRTYPRVDASDDVSCQANFVVLMYPGYLALKEQGDALAPELDVRHGVTPPTLIVMAQDDPVRVENALVYHRALKDANVPVEMHLYPEGGHGFGIRRTERPITGWPDRVAEWMQANGWLDR